MMDPLVITIVSRSIERLFIILIGGLSVYLGWNLFKLPIPNDGGAEIKHGELQIVLRRIGPGVFFALFGTAVTAFSLAYPVHYEDFRSPSKQSNSSAPNDAIERREWTGASGNNRDILRSKTRALNTAIKAIELRGDENVRRAAFNDLALAASDLRVIRDDLIQLQFGTNLVALWTAKGKDYLKNPNSLPLEERQKLHEISSWYTETLNAQMMEPR